MTNKVILKLKLINNILKKDNTNFAVNFKNLTNKWFIKLNKYKQSNNKLLYNDYLNNIKNKINKILKILGQRGGSAKVSLDQFKSAFLSYMTEGDKQTGQREGLQKRGFGNVDYYTNFYLTIIEKVPELSKCFNTETEENEKTIMDEVKNNDFLKNHKITLPMKSADDSIQNWGVTVVIYLFSDLFEIPFIMEKLGEHADASFVVKQREHVIPEGEDISINWDNTLKLAAKKAYNDPLKFLTNNGDNIKEILRIEKLEDWQEVSEEDFITPVEAELIDRDWRDGIVEGEGKNPGKMADGPKTGKRHEWIGNPSESQKGIFEEAKQHGIAQKQLDKWLLETQVIAINNAIAVFRDKLDMPKLNESITQAL